MYCDECKQRPATVHITQFYNGKKVEMHLCGECSAQKGPHILQFGGGFFDGGFTLPKLLGGFFGGGAPVAGKAPLAGQVGVHVCPGCGMSFNEFTQVGRLGCGECYATFENEIDPILRRIHGNYRHLGKVPTRSGGKFKLQKTIDDLKAQLQAAIGNEQYEKAAELRDRIKELEKQKSNYQGRG